MAETPSRMRGASALVQEYFEALAAQDLDAMAAFWHDELVEDFVVLGTIRGKEAARALFAELFAAAPDLEFTLDRILSVDDTTAVGQWSLQGTFNGRPFQGLEPTGRALAFRGVDIMEFEDGLLRRNTVYYDGLRFARQVGLLPPEGSASDRALVAAFNALTRVKGSLRR